MARRPLISNGPLRVAECRDGLMLYSVNDIYIGRSLERYGEYCGQETEVYRQLVRSGQVVVDAGANIGAHTVFFARSVGRGGRVHAFEPQRLVFQMLCANVALNGLPNVETYHAALGASLGSLIVPPLDYDKPENFGGLSLARRGKGEQVSVMTVDWLGLERCDLIKIDVQGMELEVLEGARTTIERFHPVLYVENDVKEKSPALIGLLLDLGYRPFWHVPKLFDARNFYGETENIFHNTVNVNMLCLPPGDPRKVQMRAVTAVDDWWQKA